MPKAQKRRKAPAKASTAQSRSASAQQGASNTRNVSAPSLTNTNGTHAAVANRRFLTPAVSSPQKLIFPAMVASGCWLMAYTMVFLTNDPNRYIFGGMAVLMALLWTFSFGVRVRKLLLLRQRSR
jgi:hypothetical protein